MLGRIASVTYCIRPELLAYKLLCFYPAVKKEGFSRNQFDLFKIRMCRIDKIVEFISNYSRWYFANEIFIFQYPVVTGRPCLSIILLSGHMPVFWKISICDVGHINAIWNVDHHGAKQVSQFNCIAMHYILQAGE